MKTEIDSLRIQLELLRTKDDEPATSSISPVSGTQAPKAVPASVQAEAPSAPLHVPAPAPDAQPNRPNISGVANLFAGRGNGGGRGGRGGGRAAGGLAALFAGRGASPAALPAADMPLQSQAKEVLRCAVTKSDKTIPPPPPLPGSKVATAPPVPGAKGVSMNFSTGICLKVGEMLMREIAAMSVSAAKNKVVPKMKMKALFWTKLKATEVVLFKVSYILLCHVDCRYCVGTNQRTGFEVG